MLAFRGLNAGYFGLTFAPVAFVKLKVELGIEFKFSARDEKPSFISVLLPDIEADNGSTAERLTDN